MLVCDVCDKGFHTFCLTPVITRVPPNGWRCHVSSYYSDYGFGAEFDFTIIIVFLRGNTATIQSTDS